MRTVILFAVAICISFPSFSQEKKKADTTIQVTMSLDNFRAVLYTIDANVDSKKVSKELIEFLQKSAQVVADKPKEQPAEKPKEQTKPKQ